MNKMFPPKLLRTKSKAIRNVNLQWLPTFSLSFGVLKLKSWFFVWNLKFPVHLVSSSQFHLWFCTSNGLLKDCWCTTFTCCLWSLDSFKDPSRFRWATYVINFPTKIRGWSGNCCVYLLHFIHATPNAVYIHQFSKKENFMFNFFSYARHHVAERFSLFSMTCASLVHTHNFFSICIHFCRANWKLIMILGLVRETMRLRELLYLPIKVIPSERNYDFDDINTDGSFCVHMNLLAFSFDGPDRKIKI